MLHSILLTFIRGLLWTHLFPRKEFRLGEGVVVRHQLFECKWLFSVYIHHIATPIQDRFHTHAFNAIVYIAHGGYVDCIKDGIGPDKPVRNEKYFAGQWRYIPRELNHRLSEAEADTYSILITGPYAALWTEETNEGLLRILTTGRRPLCEVNLR